MGTVIVFGGEKGGTGKSALTMNFACCLQSRGFDVVLLDGDKQRTTDKWSERRSQLAASDEAQPPAFDSFMKKGDLKGELRSLRKRYDYVLVDVAGAESPVLSSALLVADRLYTPMIPSRCDTDTAAAVQHLVRMHRSANPKLEAAIVLNQVTNNVHAREREIVRAREQLEPFAELLPIAPVIISVRDIIRHAYDVSRGVIEMEEWPVRHLRTAAVKASREVWRLYEHITGEQVLEATSSTEEEPHDAE